MSDANKGICGQRCNTQVLLSWIAQHSQESPREHPTGVGGGGGLGVGKLTLLHQSRAAHLTLPGRQKEKTVLGWGRSQSLSQQQFKSQVPGVKSQTQIGKAVSARSKAR